jgi:hypothetical protein
MNEAVDAILELRSDLWDAIYLVIGAIFFTSFMWFTCFAMLSKRIDKLTTLIEAAVHTHPGSSHQSESDRAHPMVSRAGHLALIVPSFTRQRVRRTEVGLYRYLGAKRWDTIQAERRRTFFHIGV